MLKTWTRRRAALSLVAVVALAAGCGGDSSDADGTADPAQPNATLTEAGEDETVVAAAAVTELGQFAELDAGLRVMVDAPVAGGDDGGPWLTVQVRVENAGAAAGQVPNIELHCGDSDGGSYQADSTLSLGDDLAPGSFLEGTVNLLLPGDSRTGEPVPPCDGPATVVVQPAAVIEGVTKTALWDIPESVISEVSDQA